MRRTCTLHGRILSLRQEESCLHYRTTWPQTSSPSNASNGILSDHERHRDTEMLLKDYLNLSPNVKSLYEQWSSVDANFKRRAPNFAGVRILRQDPWEALVGFICSSNNNIVRISQMVCLLILLPRPTV